MNINQYIEQGIKAIDLCREPHNLYEPIEYALESGGKRMRPMLALIATDIFGGKMDDVLPAAMCLEMFHNFTLLHDDLMDNADTRRGRPSVHKKWSANTAILSGDQMLIESYRLMQQVNPQYLATCLSLFTRMATEICEGQQYDMDFEYADDVTIDQYINMIRLKTAVLPATALQLGALLAGADENNQTAIYNFGINLGLAFQLRDDYLDVYGDPLTFGKKIGGDILENKKTYMRLIAYQKANEQQTTDLNTWFASGDNDAKIANITRLYSEIGADKHCLQQIDYYNTLALNNLEHITLDQHVKQPLYDILNQLLNRNK